MPALKIGIQLASLRLPLRPALQQAARLGAQAVELDGRRLFNPGEMTASALRELRKLLADMNLKVAAVAYPTRRGYEVSEQLDARVAGTKAAMQLAYSLGAAVVVNQVGRIATEENSPSRALLIEALSDLGRYGQHVGATLAAQTGSEPPAEMAGLLGALPQGCLGIDLSPGQLIVNGFSPLEAISELGSHILHVHANDAVRDLARGRGLEVPLGRGVADFPALLGALEERGYRGFFTVEREGGDNPAVDLAHSIQYLRSL